MTITTVLRRSLLALALGACASLASAATTLHVEIDTKAYSNGGYLDLQFAGSPALDLMSFADVGSFSGFGGVADAQTSGGASGSLATGYHFADSRTDANDALFSIALGGKFGFNVTIDGKAEATGNYPSMFSVSLLNANGDYLGGSSAGDQSLVNLYWTTAATTASLNVASGVAVTAVPEPESWAMLAAGLALVGVARRRKLAA